MALPPSPDLAAAIRGDMDALAELLHRHGPLIERKLAPRIPAEFRSTLAAEDVMQVTYLEAFLRIATFVGESEQAFARWLARIAAHNLQDAMRGLRREKRPPPHQRVMEDGSGSSGVSLLEQLGWVTQTPSQAAARTEADQMLEAALARLPEDYAKVIRRYDLEQQPIEVVAEQLGRSRGAVHMLRVRAHDRLRELLGSESNFFTRLPAS